MEVTRPLSAFVAGLGYDAIPEKVTRRARLLVLDTVGIAVRARHDTDSTPAMMRAVADLGLDGGTARVFGDAAGYTPAGAALVNGALAHSLDFDDTHAPASLHPSAPVVPAAFAAAGMAGASGRDTLAGIVAGYEVICRVSKALVPSAHYARGFHPTSTCGAFAAAAAAARVFGLSPEQVADAFGIVLSQSAGSMQFLANGAWTKRFQIGNAAMAGLTAATLARAGYRGASEAFEGKSGFFAGYAPDPKPERAVEGLGRDWETLGIAVKPYPACRGMHAAVDAALELRLRHNLTDDAVRRVRVGLADTALFLVGRPEEQKRDPQNVVDGQFSGHFGVAVALREGRFGWDDYATHLSDATTRALLQRIELVHDARAEAAYPEQIAATVAVETTDGRTHEAFVPVPRGEPETFLSADELRAKFAALVTPVIGQAQEARLFQAVTQLDERSVAEVFAAAAPAGAPARRSA